MWLFSDFFWQLVALFTFPVAFLALQAESLQTCFAKYVSKQFSDCDGILLSYEGD